jgi:hypothetical protein
MTSPSRIVVIARDRTAVQQPFRHRETSATIPRGIRLCRVGQRKTAWSSAHLWLFHKTEWRSPHCPCRAESPQWTATKWDGATVR